MMRRAGIALMFALLGFVSLLLVDDLLTWLCAHVSGVCRPYSGPCPGIDVCTPDALKSVLLTFIYFGPAVAFATIGFLFSRRPRPWSSWLALPSVLFAAHAVVMFAVMQATAKFSG